LHIADTHFDPYYEPGSVVNCNEPLCCRKNSTADKHNLISAGVWGSYGKCDVSKKLIDDVFLRMAKQHPDVDFIIWTGDIPPHDIWEQTREGHVDNIRYTTKKLLEAFPDTPIFAAIGNHEGLPSGHFAPSWMKSQDQTIDWLYNELMSHWSKWLPPDTNVTIMHGGFYSVLIRPKFRIISINTNYCHAFNWWLVLNSTDPSQELKWLVYELEKAEANDEKVYIIGNI
jgi:sphingomyelin phosphodiesterase